MRQIVDKSEVETITEELAVTRLIEYIKETADADDLARLYTRIISDNPTIIKCDGGDSDPFKDGDPVDLKPS